MPTRCCAKESNEMLLFRSFASTPGMRENDD